MKLLSVIILLSSFSSITFAHDESGNSNALVIKALDIIVNPDGTTVYIEPILIFPDSGIKLAIALNTTSTQGFCELAGQSSYDGAISRVVDENESVVYLKENGRFDNIVSLGGVKAIHFITCK